jgi:hypothetical protein
MLLQKSRSVSWQKNHNSVTGLTLQRTKETFVDGWVRTGDKVLIKNAEVFILDRLKVPTTQDGA